MNDTEELLEKDEDLKATESRIVELRQKKERTPEEEKEFKDLKQHHRGRVEEQISSERERAQKESERAARAEQALLDAQTRLKELQETRDTKSISGSEDEYVIVNGKKMLTEESIIARVRDGKMTQTEAWKQQRALIQEETIERMRGEEPKNEAAKVRKESLDFVNKEGYGHFLNAADPKHNPNDPLFKEASRLWENGYKHNPDGPRLALEDAKKNLNIGVKRADMSDDFSVPRNNASSDSGSQKTKKVELSEIESSNAIRFYVLGNQTNPKTGKHYTEQEALQKGLEAKRKRLGK